MLHFVRKAALASIVAVVAGPAAAQSDFSYGPGSLTVTYGSYAGCQPAVTAARARPGGASTAITLASNLRQNITVTAEVTVTLGGQNYRFSGGGNLVTGGGTITAGGDRLPANLTGSRMNVTIFYCQVNAVAPPPPSGDR